MDDETNNETETEDELAQQDGTVLPAREVMSLLSTSRPPPPHSPTRVRTSAPTSRRDPTRSTRCLRLPTRPTRTMGQCSREVTRLRSTIGLSRSAVVQPPTV
jgi:hypothetical protein